MYCLDILYCAYIVLNWILSAKRYHIASNHAIVICPTTFYVQLPLLQFLRYWYFSCISSIPFSSSGHCRFFTPLKSIQFQNQSLPPWSYFIREPLNFTQTNSPSTSIHLSFSTLALFGVFLHCGAITLRFSCGNASLVLIILSIANRHFTHLLPGYQFKPGIQRALLSLLRWTSQRWSDLFSKHYTSWEKGNKKQTPNYLTTD